MGKKIRSFKCYGVWEYEREEQELFEASKEGKQLIRGGCFHSVFESDDTVRYVYRLDYNSHIEDKERYREIFAEQGWEYINSTFNGWHYFKKRYHEGMTEEECQIYTDRETLYEMQNRFLKLCGGIAIFEGIMGILYMILSLFAQKPVIFLEGLLMASMSVFLFLVKVDRKRKRDGEEGMLRVSAQTFFAVVLVTLLILLVLMFL